jgi:triosephosphate isomerase (TIM)
MTPIRKGKNRNIVVANWKMNPQTLVDAKKLFKKTLSASQKLNKTDVVVAPPFPYIYSLQTKSKKISLAAQNGRIEKDGAFTGEVSLSMVRNAGVKYVILGHSERRASGEENTLISLKIKETLALSMTPIVCIGENKRDTSGEYLAFLEKQIQGTLAGLSLSDLKKILLAYEPVWAIGSASNGAMEPRDLHETVLYIQKIIGRKFGMGEATAIPIIYGGSVDAGNAASLMVDGMVSGFLVGRASLDGDVFTGILRAVDNF